MYLTWSMLKWVTTLHTPHISYFTLFFLLLHFRDFLYTMWLLGFVYPSLLLAANTSNAKKKTCQTHFLSLPFSILPIAVFLDQRRQEQGRRRNGGSLDTEKCCCIKRAIWTARTRTAVRSETLPYIPPGVFYEHYPFNCNWLDYNHRQQTQQNVPFAFCFACTVVGQWKKVEAGSEGRM